MFELTAPKIYRGKPGFILALIIISLTFSSNKRTNKFGARQQPLLVWRRRCERKSTIEPCGGEKAKMIYTRQHLRFLHFLARPHRGAAWELKSWARSLFHYHLFQRRRFPNPFCGHSQISFSNKSRRLAPVGFRRLIWPAKLSGALWRKEAKDACPARNPTGDNTQWINYPRTAFCLTSKNYCRRCIVCVVGACTVQELFRAMLFVSPFSPRHQCVRILIKIVSDRVIYSRQSTRALFGVSSLGRFIIKGDKFGAAGCAK